MGGGLVILVSFFAAGAFSRRVAPKHEQLQGQAVADGPGLVPGPVQSLLPPRVAVMAGASGQAGAAPQLHSHGGRLRPNRSPSMAMRAGKDDEYLPDVRK